MVAVVSAYSLLSLNTSQLSWKIVGNLMVGVTEEALLRGIVLVALVRCWGNTRRGLASAVLLSSSIFGLLHLFNIGQGVVPTLLQVTFALFVGVCFAGIFLRTGALPILMVWHGLIDVASSLETQNKILSLTKENLLFCVLTLPFALVGLLLVRGRTAGETCLSSETSSERPSGRVTCRI